MLQLNQPLFASEAACLLERGRIQATRHAHRLRLWDVPPKQSGLDALSLNRACRRRSDHADSVAIRVSAWRVKLRGRLK